MEATTWTRFSDMHSGGDQKLDWGMIVIQMPEDAAIDYFEERFGRDPMNVTCDCCGDDYSVQEFTSLADVLQWGVPGLVILADKTELTGDDKDAWLEAHK